MINKQELSDLIRDSLEIELYFRDYKTNHYIDSLCRHFYPCIGSKVELPIKSRNAKKYIVKDIAFWFNTNRTGKHDDTIDILVEEITE